MVWQRVSGRIAGFHAPIDVQVSQRLNELARCQRARKRDLALFRLEICTDIYFFCSQLCIHILVIIFPIIIQYSHSRIYYRMAWQWQAWHFITGPSSLFISTHSLELSSAFFLFKLCFPRRKKRVELNTHIYK